MKTFSADAIARIDPLPIEERSRRAAREAANADTDETPTISTGERNPTLFAKGAQLKELGYTEEEIFEMLEVINQARCDVPLDLDEIKSLAENVFEYTNPLTKDEKRDYAIRNVLRYPSGSKDLLARLQELDPLGYSHDEKGLARLFADLYKRKCRFNTTEKEWMVFNDKLWKTDTLGMQVATLAKEFSDALLIYGTTISNQSIKQNFIMFASKTTRAKVRETMIRDARDIHHITKADLDKNPDLFNCQNGTFNLKTFERQEFNPDDLISRISNVTYDPKIRSKDFEDFIKGILRSNKEKMRYLQKALGYALTAETHIEACFILYGATTRNGKGTLVETFAKMLGNAGGYAMTIKPETLATKQNNDSRQANNDIAKLDGCRFLNAAEPKKNMIFDSGLLKQLTGRDMITARFNYGLEFDFMPKFKLFMNTNFLPTIKEDTLFSSGRINVITFDQHFYSATEKGTPKQDPTLKDRLQKNPHNISGIFNWCLDGLRMFREEGLVPPQCVLDATADYREKSDKVGNFWDDRMEESPKSVIKIADVYEAYQRWCTTNGFKAENKGNFYEMLKNKDYWNATGTIDGKTERNVVKGWEIKALPIVFRGNV
ncbi:MAG: phage/plasmid primase, P4 family [Firmicutes bacterium]|nr:phage/plasmid primase, P4 family [Bacillota bacterium]